ncbi:putatice primase [uncultured Mediterranean phage uvMED]|nr:putatice primase [uncultured Mediterranean phage uvMED]BAR22600.1 ATPase P [uncultured Mediterranean phage uvMED]
MEISYFNKITSRDPISVIGIDEFLNNVKNGVWKHLIDPINAEQDKEKRGELKKNTLPYVTVSGTFSTRKKDGLLNHSGVLCIDIDDSEDLERDYKNLSSDPYTYAVFKSASGKGFAVFVLINGAKHLESFKGLELYYLEKYGIAIDKSCKDITRARFVSSDPEAVINPKSKKFTDTKKEAAPKKIPNIITGESDIKHLIEQIEEGGLDLTNGDYEQYLNIGFALASEYGDAGRQYFHAISQNSSKYDPERCDNQFNNCVKSNGNGVTIGTLFFYAKQSGLSLVSENTQIITVAAKLAKNGGRDQESAYNVLKEINGIEKDEAQEVVEKVFSSKVDSFTSELPDHVQVEHFLRDFFNLKRSTITRKIYDNESELGKVEFNSIWRKSLSVINDKITYPMVERFILSDLTPNFDPLSDFFEKNEHKATEGNIKALAACISSNSGYSDDNFDTDFVEVFLTKWLVGMVGSAMGKHSPLLLVLTGGQGTGKTEFFRRLLPKEIHTFYAESKLDRDKDDEILMTQKLVIMDDELGGKSKKESKRLKELTSKAYFSLREPYGAANVDLRRLAVLCGTTNEEKILSDPTGNRRIIPIDVQSIDHDKYNAIDKTALLMEAYKLFLAGYSWDLSKEEKEMLNRNTIQNEVISMERELINEYFKLPKYAEGGEIVEYLTATQIKRYIEINSTLKVWGVAKLGQELQAAGYKNERRRVNGTLGRFYGLIKTRGDGSDMPI